MSYRRQSDSRNITGDANKAFEVTFSEDTGESFLKKCEKASKTLNESGSISAGNTRSSNTGPNPFGTSMTAGHVSTKPKDGFDPIIRMDYQMVSQRRSVRHQSKKLQQQHQIIKQKLSMLVQGQDPASLNQMREESNDPS